MKLLELEIKNIRGIKSINITPQGENVVVFGPNGTGKSAIVDSIDFLLTGKISRLTGEGSEKLFLKEHGPHVDSRDDLKNTIVRAKVEIENKTLFLERSVDRPTSLKIEPEVDKDLALSYLGMAELGQHILSRREILRYVTAEAGKRAKEIQGLLDLTEIENLRAMLVNIENEAESESKSSESNFTIAKSDICKLLSLVEFSEEATLERINELRGILKGPELSAELTPEKIKADLSPSLPFSTKKGLLTVDEIENNINEIRGFTQKKDEIICKESELEVILKEILAEIKLKQYSLYKRLFETGIRLVDETNVCPLCGREWKEGDFKVFLEQKIKETDVAQEKQTAVSTISSSIKQRIDLLRNDVETLLKAHEQFDLKTLDSGKANEYLSNLKSWSDIMLNPTEIFENNKWPTASISTIFDTSFLEDKLLNPLGDSLKKVGEHLSKSQTAWDTLTKMEDKWKKYKEELNRKETAELFKNRAKALLRQFQEARDSTLESIYDAIKDNFNEYYTTIHAEDEKAFSSKIKHEGAKLIFEVDFYGRGLFPPHALHSEGHQDSMGVCLFFALNKYLTQDKINLIILDDVVMSIDRSHRRGFCGMLKKCFPGKQFIITTHDAAWAKQLKTEGIVKLKNMIHFVYWNIETGPIFELEKDLWDRINEDLKKNDIPSAAHKLRYNAECYFEHVCDFLNARVPYKGNHQWELGDFAPAAVSIYKDYLRKSKSTFQKMKQPDKVEELNGLEQKANDIINKSQVEQWIVNENVHYNRWENFTKEDFMPVVEAFKDLFGLFTCSFCGSIIAVSYTKAVTPKTTVSCGCGKIFLNIE